MSNSGETMQKVTMIDVSKKPIQKRTARAQGIIHLAENTIAAIKNQALEKGDVLAVAKIAGIQAAKETARLIPLCHPLTLEHVAINLEVTSHSVIVVSEVCSIGRTGVEMEALTAVSGALLTIYDMCKPIDKQMKIGDILLLNKVKENV